MLRELKLGNLSILQLASGITAAEPGLVSGAQIVSYIEEKLSSLGTGTWNGGTVSNATIFDATVCVSYGSWVTYGYPSIPWMSIPSAAVPCKSQIETYTASAALARPATGQIGQILHLTASGPAWTDLTPPSGEASYSGPAVYQNSYFVVEDWHKSESLPPGWYKVDLILVASGTAATLNLIDRHAVQTGRVKNVMGMAWSAGGANESLPCVTLSGTSWINRQGTLESSVPVNILQINFLYEHMLGNAVWMGSGLTGEHAAWKSGSLRYTSIQKPEEVHNVSTLLPTVPPTDVTTEVPTEGPTAPPTDPPSDETTEVPTEGPTDPPDEIPLNIHPESK